MKKQIAMLVFALVIIVAGCKKEEVVLYNTQPTPNLDNPVIQKLSIGTWYREGMSASKEEWTSMDNIPKPSEAMASILYAMAWRSISIYRDGTSVMLFTPPMFTNAYIHCKGTWKVSETEENTIIMTIKTPVSNATLKLKVLNLETKENVGYLKASLDFGNRLITASLVNSNPFSWATPEEVEAMDYSWFAAQSVSNTVLSESDVLGAWSSASFTTENREKYPKEYIVRSTYIEDLLAQTPNFLGGIRFNLQSGGKAAIAYPDSYFAELDLDKQVLSDASWKLKGNKLIIETDEEYFYSFGELLFGFSVHATGIRQLGMAGIMPIRIQQNRYYIIEIISREAHGNWCRITTNDAVFNAFLFKSSVDLQNSINIREIF